MRLLILLTAMTVAARAQSDVPAQAYWGRPVSYSSARDLVPGAGWYDAGPGDLFLRPARLGFVARPGVELGWGARLLSEQRTRTVYDQFENAIGETVVADNLSISWLGGPAAGVFPFGGIAAVAAGIRPVTDYNYSYYKEYRDDFYVLTGSDRVAAAGVLYEAALGAGVRPLRWLSLGASAGYRFGARRLRVETVRVPDTTVYEESGKPAGLGYSAGLALAPLDRLQFDAGYSGGLDLADWRSADEGITELARNQPWSARLGAAYMAPGILPSRLTVEAGYTGWSAVDTTWSDIFSVRAGVEHTLAGALRLRYGVGIEPLPFASHIQRAELGMGLGWDAGIARFDLGMNFGREVIGAAQFPGGLDPDDQHVYQTGSAFCLTVSRDF